MMKEMLYQLKNLVKKLLPDFLIDWYHFGLAWFSAVIYCLPGKKMKIIAVTGTNGKSTVIEMLSRILEEAGFKVASLSSIRFKILDREEINDKRMTMPGRFFVQRFLKRAKDQGCSHVILEVTSEGIRQHRHEFINFDTAIFTNLSPEHIESHGSFEKYREAKGQLFKATKSIHVLNLDDDNIDFFSQFPAKEKWGFGLEMTDSQIPITNQAPNPKGRIQDIRYKIQNTIRAGNIQATAGGSRYIVDGLEFDLKLLGEFNIYNALAAIAAAQSQGISLETCKKALEKMKGMPGRMEEVITEPFRVLVDYAFTPNALEKVYETLTKNYSEQNAQYIGRDARYKLQTSKLICVLGSCGGGRDKWKRPVLGEIASRFCHQIILTNEDPYDEDPRSIVEEIKKGVPDLSYEMFATSIILDRRAAIAQALKMARPGDVVVVTGKGCESSICLAHGQRVIWDDRQVVREEMEKVMTGKPAFKILPHPADVKIQIEGRTQAELFSSANRAMIEILKPEMTRQTGSACAVQVTSPDASTLLVDFLNQILYLIQTNREVYPEIEFEQIGEREVRSKMTGQKVKSFGKDIKAVTYHDLRVQQKGGFWEATVLFDV